MGWHKVSNQENNLQRIIFEVRNEEIEEEKVVEQSIPDEGIVNETSRDGSTSNYWRVFSSY